MSTAAVFPSGMEHVSAIKGVEPMFSSECEELVLDDGVEAADKVYNDEYPGFSGKGFAWVKGGGSMTFTVTVPETGMYRLETKALMYLGSEGESRQAEATVVSGDYKKTYTVKVPHTDTWSDFSFGDIKLFKGENTVSFGGGWGYCLYDTVTLTRTPAPDYSKASAVPVDPDATKETKALMSYLSSVYGKHIISGQQEIYGGGNDGDMELEFDFIKEKTGKLPAIRGFDMMNYNPLYGWEDGTTERLIDWVKNKNGIATTSWHINVPIDFENYTLGDTVDWQKCTYKNYQASNSTFNTANILEEGTKERAYFDAAVEDLAEQLLLCQEAGVPILFRPFHEAQGNEGNYGDGTAWFWWGDRGPEVLKSLWKLLYSKLTEEYGLHNLIWEFNSYNYANSPSWYPGDEYVDIVAYDKYNCEFNRDDGLTGGPNLSAITGIYNYLVDLTEGRKMVAMTENDTIPSLDNLTIENAGWLYFCPWYGEFIMSENKQNYEELNKIYNSEYCLTLDEMPADLYKTASDDKPDVTTKPDEPIKPDDTTDTPGAEDVTYGDIDENGSIDITDLSMLSLFLIGDIDLSDNSEKAADVTGNNSVDLSDLARLKQF
ncbi:MAG: beta-mannosidase, partial [Ruminococcus sp.]|nr:beta-mannosidase [Ruminococcus sp.]